MSCRVCRRPAPIAWRSATGRADRALLRVTSAPLTATCGVRGSFRTRGTFLPCCTTRRPWPPSASTLAPCASRQAASLPSTRSQRLCIVLFPSASVWSRICLKQAQVRSCCDVDWWACKCDGSRCRRALLVPLIPAAPHGSCKWPRCRSSSFLLLHLLAAALSDEQPCAGLATDELQLGGPIILVAIRRQGISGFTSCAQGLTRWSRPRACRARILRLDSSAHSGIIAQSVQEKEQERDRKVARQDSACCSCCPLKSANLALPGRAACRWRCAGGATRELQGKRWRERDGDEVISPDAFPEWMTLSGRGGSDGRSVKTAGMSGMSSPGASSAWQTTAPAQAPPAPQGYYQQPPQPMYARPPAVQQGYYPHLLPGQPGVPEVRLVKLRVHSSGPLLPPLPQHLLQPSSPLSVLPTLAACL